MPAVFPLFLCWLESIWQLCNSKVTQFRLNSDHFKSVDVDVITVYNLTLWTWTCFNVQLWRWSSSLWWQPRRRWRKVRKSWWSASEKTLEPGRAPKVWEELLPAASWCYSEVTGMWSACFMKCYATLQEMCSPHARVVVMQRVRTAQLNAFLSLLSYSKKLNNTGGLKQLQWRGENAQIPLPSSVRPAFHVSLNLFATRRTP